MAENPWVPFYFADYLADTARLSLAEHGAYILLLAEAYRHGGRLPCKRIVRASPEHASLHRVCRATSAEDVDAVDAVLAAFFVFDGTSYLHPRVKKEVAKLANRSRKASQAARKRWDADASPKHAIRMCSSDAPHNHNHNHSKNPSSPTHKTAVLGESATPADVEDGVCVGKGPTGDSGSTKINQATLLATGVEIASPSKPVAVGEASAPRVSNRSLIGTATDRDARSGPTPGGNFPQHREGRRPARTDAELTPFLAAWNNATGQFLPWGAKTMRPCEVIFAHGQAADRIERAMRFYRHTLKDGVPSLKNFAEDVARWDGECESRRSKTGQGASAQTSRESWIAQGRCPDHPGFIRDPATGECEICVGLREHADRKRSAVGTVPTADGGNSNV